MTLFLLSSSKWVTSRSEHISAAAFIWWSKDGNTKSVISKHWDRKSEKSGLVNLISGFSKGRTTADGRSENRFIKHSRRWVRPRRWIFSSSIKGLMHLTLTFLWVSLGEGLKCCWQSVLLGSANLKLNSLSSSLSLLLSVSSLLPLTPFYTYG